MASYVSVVLVWIMTEVSPRWKYSDLFVTVRTTEQDVVRNPASAVRAAMATETMILSSCLRVITVRVFDFLSLAGTIIFNFRVQKYNKKTEPPNFGVPSVKKTEFYCIA